ncbi:RNA polymerase-associated protein leo1-like [Plakobranchus ocellatus]|uniref:RNA polymerase-associated protein leo1-like n=1 Tax=Plakobranchus ocellatus TaxID=259542 RepID=A0AAV3YGW2_9GAST|nr:RNA polymerase-associated protein leo1-like [Plakobranchus ocellatus]
MSSLKDTFLEQYEHGNYEDKGSRNKWLWSWLDVIVCNGDYFAKYIRKTKAPGKAVCLICNHGEGKTLEYSESAPASERCAISLQDCTANLEALLCTFIAENNLPLSIAPKLVELSTELAKDVKALSHLKLSHRWLSLLDGSKRFHDLIEPLTIFYYSFMGTADKELYKTTLTNLLTGLNKQKRGRVFAIMTCLKKKGLTRLGKARKERIYQKLFFTRNKTLSLMHFFLDTLPIFKSFNLAFEKSEPMIHQLFDEVLQLSRLFLGNSMKSEHVLGNNLQSLQMDENDMKAVNDIFIGEKCSKLLAKTKRLF